MRHRGSAVALTVAMLAAALASKHRPSYLGAHTTEEILAKQQSMIGISNEGLALFASTENRISGPESPLTVSISLDSPTLADALFLGVWCDREPFNLSSGLLDYLEITPAHTAARSLKLQLHPIRCPQVIRLVGAGPRVLASSAPINADPSQQVPYALRFAYGDATSRSSSKYTPSAGSNATSMWVSWTSASNATPTVRLGTSPGVYTTATAGATRTYTAADACNAPANTTSVLYYLDPGYVSDVHLTGLVPSTRYYIAYGQNSSALITGSFRTGPVVGPDVPVAFAAFGDMALSFDPGATSTVRSIAARNASLDFVAHFGDLGYAEGSTVVWDTWMAYCAPLMATMPYMVSVGNHEADHALDLACPNNPAGEPVQFAPSWGNYVDDSQGEGGEKLLNEGVVLEYSTIPRLR